MTDCISFHFHPPATFLTLMPVSASPLSRSRVRARPCGTSCCMFFFFTANALRGVLLPSFLLPLPPFAPSLSFSPREVFERGQPLLPTFLLAFLFGGKSEREREKDTPDSHPPGGRLLFSLAFFPKGRGEAKAYGLIFLFSSFSHRSAEGVLSPTHERAIKGERWKCWFSIAWHIVVIDSRLQLHNSVLCVFVMIPRTGNGWA